MSSLKYLKALMTIVMVVCMLPHVRGQSTDSTILDWRRGLFPKEKDGELYQIKATGFYRFFGTFLYQ